MARVVAIVNPVAGKARGARLRAKVVEELKRLFPDIAFIETNAPGHATELARAAMGSELIIAVGGDGTAREVASGLMCATGPLDHLTTRPLLAVIPVGSCNDLPKNVGIPPDVIRACRVVKEGRASPIDVIRVEMSNAASSDVTYFVNAAGFGFDATVTAEAHRSKYLSGLPLYLVAVVRALRDLDCPLVRIRAGELSSALPTSQYATEQRVLMIAAANGRYYGGGMKVAPEAQPDDGLIEVCIGFSMGRFATLRKLPRFVAGTHVSLKEVRMLRAPELDLEFLEPVQIELDGDVLSPQPYRRFRLTALPKAISIRVA